jgi:hypothetical protein
MRFRRTIVLLSAMTLALSACSGEDIAGNIAEEVLENQEGVGDVEIDENNGSIVIEVEDEDGGGSAVIGGGDVPDDFPIPVPDGGSVNFSSSNEQGTSLNITYPVSEYESLVATYQTFADGVGGDVTTYNTTNPNSQTWLVSTETESYSISVTESGSDANVFLVTATN